MANQDEKRVGDSEAGKRMGDTTPPASGDDFLSIAQKKPSPFSLSG
jgi:hypothetical protein